MKKIVDAPTVPGLPYSAGVIAAGLCFVAGQFGTDADDRPVGEIEQQTALALDRIEAILAQAGCDLSHIVRTTVWLRSLDDFAGMNRAYLARASPRSRPPASQSRWRICSSGPPSRSTPSRSSHPKRHRTNRSLRRGRQSLPLSLRYGPCSRHGAKWSWPR